MKHIDKVFNEYKEGEIDINHALKECVPLIRSTLMKRWNRVDDDLEQESFIIAMKCFENFSHSKKCSFSTYLYNNIKWKINRYIWQDKLIKKPVHILERGIDSINYEILPSHLKFKGKGVHKEISVIDLVEFDDTLDKNFIDNFILKSILKRLKEEHRKLLLLWAAGYTYKDISKIYSISHSGAEQKVKRALNIARNILKNSEFKNEYKIIENKVEYNPDKTKTGRDRKTKYDKTLLNEIRERKMPLREIAEKYNIKLKTVVNLDQRIKKGRI